MPVTYQALQVPQAMCEAYHYEKPSAFSRGMSVDISGQARMVFVSGTASVGDGGESLHVGDFSAQTRRMYENARAVLRDAGADWKNVVKATVFIKDIQKHYDEFNKIRCAYFQEMGLEVFPASTCVEARLCREDLLVEMELVAVVGK